MIGPYLSGVPAGSSGGGNLTKLFDSILGANAASINTGQIAQTYEHLLGVVSARTVGAVTSENLGLQFNGVTTASYYTQNSTLAYMFIGAVPGASALAASFGTFVFLIADYTLTSKNPLVSSFYASVISSASQIAGTNVGGINGVGPVNSIQLLAPSFNQLAANTRLTLYGLN